MNTASRWRAGSCPQRRQPSTTAATRQQARHARGRCALLKEGSHLRRLQPLATPAWMRMMTPQRRQPSTTAATPPTSSSSPGLKILKEGSHLRRLQLENGPLKGHKVSPQRRQPSTTAATAPVSYIVYDAVPAPCCERCLVSLESECIPLSLFPGRPCDISRQARP